MGFRFSRRVSIIPGLRVNLSKHGASVSIGPRCLVHVRAAWSPCDRRAPRDGALLALLARTRQLRSVWRTVLAMGFGKGSADVKKKIYI